MFRALTSLMAVLMATAFAVVAPCSCAAGQAQASEAPGQEGEESSEHDCCDSKDDEAPAERDKDDCECGQCDGDCATTSEDDPTAQKGGAGALVPERDASDDLDELTPRLQALIISWLADKDFQPASDEPLAFGSSNSPPSSTTPTYLNLQVLRL